MPTSMRFTFPMTLLASLAAGCAHGLAGVETTAAKALVSDEQEKQIGEQVKTELETKDHVKYVDDPAVVGFVKSITDKILPLAEKDRPGVAWQVKVIDDPKTVNAFATPGGYLYVYSGLLQAAADPAEVAGVLSHEAGHVVARHSARQMVDAFGLQAIAGLALGQNPGLASQLAASVGAKGFMLANSRGDETEADEYGARYAAAAGFDPRGLVTFFEKLKAQEGKGSQALAFLSDHPATGDRIQHVESYIKEHHLTASGGRDPAPLAAAKAKLAK
ncbi:MAG TPA: M48 family metalloprotease [Anaeromyxobacteraceae bacterium]|nr:M48 family metalloprotease [Anaeromyxobacteraceae bacterium]